MRFSKVLLLMAALGCAVAGLGQEGPGSEFRRFKNAVVINPVNMFDVINPSLQVGVERRLNARFHCVWKGG